VHSNTTTVADFNLEPAEAADVKGTVLTPEGVPVPRANVALSPIANGDVRILVSATATADADGAFVIRNVPVGAYVVQVQTFTPRSFGYSTIDVGGKAVGVRVQAMPAAALSGHVIFDGSWPHPAPSDVIPTFPMATDFVTSPAETSVWAPRWSEDGTFSVSNATGRLLLRPTARPDSWVMTDISLSGVDVIDTSDRFHAWRCYRPLDYISENRGDGIRAGDGHRPND
jgi:hypothetical protein